MRTKLLRALAHLKAAQEHLRCAQRLIYGDFHIDSTNAVNGALASGQGALVAVGARYAKVVVDNLTPAELP